MCMGVFPACNICTPHTTSMPSTSGGEKMILELELLLELALLVSHSGGAGNHTHVLWMSSV